MSQRQHCTARYSTRGVSHCVNILLLKLQWLMSSPASDFPELGQVRHFYLFIYFLTGILRPGHFLANVKKSYESFNKYGNKVMQVI